MINLENINKFVSKYFDVSIKYDTYNIVYECCKDNECIGYIYYDSLHEYLEINLYDEYAFLEEDIYNTAYEVDND